MSNPTAPIGLTFAGTDIQHADLGIFLELASGLNEPPSVRGKDLVVPGTAGRTVRNRVADNRKIELVGMISGHGSTYALAKADFRYNMKAVQALFDATAAPATLQATLEDSTTASILARTVSMVWREVSPIVAVVSIELESGSPNWTIA